MVKAERAVFLRETLNSRISIAFNDSGTANYHLRPAVFRLLQQIKDRRIKMLDVGSYRNEEFIKFFVKHNSL